MYIIVKHYVTINAYTVERIIDNEVDAIALVDIYNRNNKDADVKYVLTKVIKQLIIIVVVVDNMFIATTI